MGKCAVKSFFYLKMIEPELIQIRPVSEAWKSPAINSASLSSLKMNRSCACSASMFWRAPALS
ncbi:protein of unknown function [Methylocella tundrae]|uniref:Uncharacterized protein n=1 Tax=Methylocella tundrae TaxID=227605 RepID=A0A4U8Z606_METTU|nr:protein of unknown function [Methylocella tundrae]